MCAKSAVYTKFSPFQAQRLIDQMPKAATIEDDIEEKEAEQQKQKKKMEKEAEKKDDGEEQVLSVAAHWAAHDAGLLIAGFLHHTDRRATKVPFHRGHFMHLFCSRVQTHEMVHLCSRTVDMFPVPTEDSGG